MIFNLWKFESKEPNETIIFLIRRHPIILLKGIFQIVAIIFLIIIIPIFFSFNSTTTIIIIFGILLSILIAATNLYRWFNDLYLLTDRRLIDVDQKTVFARVVTETALDQIQDVTYEVSGVLPSLLNFGKVAIQTAGAVQDIQITVVSNPSGVQSQISKAFNDYRAKMRFSIDKETSLPRMNNQNVDNNGGRSEQNIS